MKQAIITGIVFVITNFINIVLYTNFSQRWKELKIDNLKRKLDLLERVHEIKQKGITIPESLEEYLKNL